MASRYPEAVEHGDDASVLDESISQVVSLDQKCNLTTEMQSYQLKTIWHHSALPVPGNPSSWRRTVDLDYSVFVIGVVAVLYHNDHRPVSSNRIRAARVQGRRRVASALVAVAKSRSHLGNRRRKPGNVRRVNVLRFFHDREGGMVPAEAGLSGATERRVCSQVHVCILQ